MAKFKVTSGEFEIIINASSYQKAANQAIMLHDCANSTRKLGELTMVEKLNNLSKRVGDEVFMATNYLILKNTMTGLGMNEGQYSHVDKS